MTVLFATFLLISLGLAAGVAFSTERARPRLKWMLIGCLFLCWIALGLAVQQILARTAATLVTPGGARQPHLLDPATHQALVLAASLGAPALIATALGWLSIKASRPGRRVE